MYGTSTQNLNETVSIEAGGTRVVDFEWRCSLQNGQYILSAGVAKVLASEAKFTVLHLLQSAYAFTAHTDCQFMGNFNMDSTAIVYPQDNEALCVSQK